MAVAYRFVEACALFPMLFVPSDRDNVVFCTGPQAELLAADCLRWRDVKTVYLTSPPTRPVLPNPVKAPELKDKRLVVGTPPVGSCAAILTSPGEDPEPYLAALRSDGVVCATTTKVADVQPMLSRMRKLFPKGCMPWREFLPEEIYGCLACPMGAPRRSRGVPKGAKRLSNGYISAMLIFAGDEVPMVLSAPSGTTDMVKVS